MKTVENQVLQLAEEIYSGRCNYQKTISRIQVLEQEYESLERNIAYPELSDQITQEYLDELIGRVRVGLYSKQLLLDLAKASDEVHAMAGKKRSINKVVIAGIAIAAVVVIVTILAVGLGE